MSRQHHFHLDRAGHSITIDLRRGRTSEVWLLVDGRETGLRRERSSDVVTLDGELADDPPQRFTVRVEHVRERSGLPICTLMLGDSELPVPERVGPTDFWDRRPGRQLGTE